MVEDVSESARRSRRTGVLRDISRLVARVSERLEDYPEERRERVVLPALRTAGYVLIGVPFESDKLAADCVQTLRAVLENHAETCDLGADCSCGVGRAYVCAHCGSPDVQSLQWVGINDGLVYEDGSESEPWCQKCEVHDVPLVFADEYVADASRPALVDLSRRERT